MIPQLLQLPQLLLDNPKAVLVPLRDMEQLIGILNWNWLGDDCDNERPDIQLDGGRVVVTFWVCNCPEEEVVDGCDD